MEFLREKRIVTICLALLLAFLALAVRLYLIQTGQGTAYALKALRQRTVEVGLEAVSRGDILDRKGRSLLDSRTEPRLIVFPALIKNKELAAEQLTKILKLQEQEILKRLHGKANVWPEKLSQTQQDQLEALKTDGLELQAVELRYGARPLATNTIGYLGKIESKQELARLRAASFTQATSLVEMGKKYTMSDLTGKTGLESYYELQLKGTTPRRTQAVTLDGWGNYVRGLGLTDREAEDLGRNSLVLTLDRDIQRMAEDTLQAQGLNGTVVVMEADSGDLLALASNPTFRPDQVGDYLTPGAELTFLDQARCLWQPGSVFKVLVASAALEEGVATTATKLPCDNSLIKCNIWPQHTDLSLAKALELSCNPAFARLGLELGGTRLAQYARLFGLDNQSIIGVPTENDKRQNWEKVASDLVNSSIGQGPVLVTPIQLTAMMAVVANGGSYVQPRLVKELRDQGGRTVTGFPAGQKRRVISPQTASQMTAMLEDVVNQGTGRNAGTSGLRVAGKTGSAQTGKGLKTKPGEDSSGTEAWFTGFFPAEDPQYVVTVLIHDGVSGGETAAPVFRAISQGLTSLSN